MKRAKAPKPKAVDPDEERRLKHEVPKELATRHLWHFVKQSWHVVEPAEPFVDNWHIHAICDHLEAVTAGTIPKLLINVPPGTMKSLLVCVFWPAWVWASQPGKRFMYSSYSESLSLRDSVKTRDLICSQWYQERWPLGLKEDQNAKGRFDNSAGGWRIVGSITGKGIGEHPDFNVGDDPHNVLQAESDADRQTVTRWFESVFSVRGEIRDCKRVLVMQRLHSQDCSGVALDKGGWTHICLPMRYEAPAPADPKLPVSASNPLIPRQARTVIGWTDPRTTDGELLWPAKYTEAKVANLEGAMGLYSSAGQLQQRPTPRGGAKFKRAWFDVMTTPPQLTDIVRYWDKAGCLIQGTIITTRRGDMPIEQVTSSDEVLTRDGWRRVAWSGATKCVKSITAIVFKDGQHVSGTPDHKIWVDDSHWLELASIRGTNYARGIWETKSIHSSSSRESSLRKSAGRDTTRQCAGATLKRNTQQTRFIARYGEALTARFPLVRISTTRTKTGITILLTILNALQGPNTCSSIEISFGRRSIDACLLVLERRLRSVLQNTKKQIASRLKAASAGSPHGRASKRGTSDAIIAVAISNARLLLRQNTVRIDAKTVRAGKGRNCGVPVFDLTVQGRHEYFANGILVHNTRGGSGARSCGVLMGKFTDQSAALATFREKFIVLDVTTCREEAAEREKIIQQTADTDRARWGSVTVWVEQEPGSGGKESATSTVGNLVGHACYIERVTGSKEVRAEPLMSQSSVGKVKLLLGNWTQGFLDELEHFPNGKLKDQVDGASGAFNKLWTGTGAFSAAGDLQSPGPKAEGETFFDAGSEPASDRGDDFFT